MIRKDREITDRAEQLAIMEACDVCRVALNGEDGYPYVVPLNFGVEVAGDEVTLYFHSARRGLKLDLIARDPRATFEMDCDHELIFYDERMSCTMGYRSVIGRGRIEVVPDDERTHGLDVLMRHYHAEDFAYNPKTVPATCVWRLSVESMVGKRRDNVHPGEHRWEPSVRTEGTVASARTSGLALRRAGRADVPLVLRFIRELARYEQMEDQVVADEATLERELFDERGAEVLLAEKDGAPMGFALFFQNFSTYLGHRGIYLEDLYVRPEARGCGVGTALIRELARVAVERGCGRLEWWCLDWNEPSIRFYRGLGAEAMDDWTVYRVSGDALGLLAGSAGDR